VAVPGAARAEPTHPLQPDYVWSARNYWNSPYHSSESALGWLATRMAGATTKGRRSISAGWARCTRALPGGIRRPAGGLRASCPAGGDDLAAIVPLVAFTDVCYTAYLNSFYMDAAALSGLLLMAASAVWMAADRAPRAAPLGVFALAALLFVTRSAACGVDGFAGGLLIARGAR